MQVVVVEKQFCEIREELVFFKEYDSKVGKENEWLILEVNEFKMQFECFFFESKEVQIIMDVFKEVNVEFIVELDDVKQQFLDIKMNVKELGVVLDEKEKKKVEKMVKMMVGFDFGVDVFSDNEWFIVEVIEKFDVFYEQSVVGDYIVFDELKVFCVKMVEIQGIVC